jgi:hypothetical protein
VINRQRVAALLIELCEELGVAPPAPKRKRIRAERPLRVVPSDLQRQKAKRILKEILPR